MKLSKDVPCDIVVRERWKFLDNCPVCRLIKRCLAEGREIPEEELEEAFAEAEEVED